MSRYDVKTDQAVRRCCELTFVRRAGVSIDELLADYPYLDREDVMQALRYAAWRAEEREVTLRSA